MRANGTNCIWVWSLTGLVTGLGPTVRGTPLGTAFTYQGQLKKAGQRVTGTCCSLAFSLWNDAGIATCPAGGNQIGPTIVFDSQGGNPPAVCPTDGLFTVILDFGVSAIDGTARWLQMAVQCPGDAGFNPLCPRQELTPAPYALWAAGGNASGVSWFGDGSDGDVTISSDTTLATDKYYNNLTVNPNRTLNPAGYRVFVKNTLTLNGMIVRNGSTGGVGGDAGTAGGTGGSLVLQRCIASGR